MFLLDTDTLIYALKGHAPVMDAIRRHADAPIGISVISYGELIFGAQKSQQLNQNLAKVHQLRNIYPLINVDAPVMECFGSLKAGLQTQGTTIADFDLLIGASALTHGYQVVTNNIRHFEKIPGLGLQNWAR